MKVLNLLVANVCFVMGLASTGCDPAAEMGASDEVESHNDSGDGCHTWQCGFNYAEVDGRAIRELNVHGVANSSNVKIASFNAPAGLLGYKLGVQNDELVATKAGATTLRGNSLVGGTVTLLVKQPGLLDLWLPTVITIAGYDEIPSWAVGAPDTATYALVYPDASSSTGTHNVCNGDLTDTLATAAIVLGSETYDLDTKEVNENLADWFTIGCAASAVAKTRLFNNGPQSDFDVNGNAASVDQRQATLKMITADYCGNGTSYTANSTPLQFEDAAGTVAVSGTPGPIEAIWTAEGALCLGTTRIPNTSVACSLPSCAGFDVSDGVWATYVPVP